MKTKEVPVLVNRRNFKYIEGVHSQKIEGESMTVPDESITLQEILQRFTRGVDPMLTRIPNKNDGLELEDDVINFKDLSDITEIEETLSDLKSRIKEGQQRVKELKEEKEKKTE
jgi:hypothetical protein